MGEDQKPKFAKGGVVKGPSVEGLLRDRRPQHGSRLRDRALDLIELARHPRLIPAGAGLAEVDERSADREAQLALAAAMLDLADALRSTTETTVTVRQPSLPETALALGERIKRERRRSS